MATVIPCTCEGEMSSSQRRGPTGALTSDLQGGCIMVGAQAATHPGPGTSHTPPSVNACPAASRGLVAVASLDRRVSLPQSSFPIRAKSTDERPESMWEPWPRLNYLNESGPWFYRGLHHMKRIAEGRYS
ncbi:hypothetical protein NDU88_002140 [Pleurodeles waltl]|uniref:Uncharacterized protein n=1 Tax=Pleurodeles waltl TaxID=8319 RepID=A0AAV7MLR8_PLEWA|nr:hypothetical protein NDU88_002140 [Pleurodeles waltl]